MIPAVAISLLLICWALSMSSAFDSGVKNLETKATYQKAVTYTTAGTAADAYSHRFFRGTGFLRTIGTAEKPGGSGINKPIMVEFLDLEQAPLSFGGARSDGAIVPERYRYLNGADIGDATSKPPAAP